MCMHVHMYHCNNKTLQDADGVNNPDDVKL